MKRVYMTPETHPDGNCMTACLASIFELELTDVPELYYGVGPTYNDMLPIISKWVSKWGLVPVIVDDSNYIWDIVAQLDYVIATGPTVDGNHAVVIYRGAIVHDPDRDNTEINNIKKFDGFLIFVVQDTARYLKLYNKLTGKLKPFRDERSFVGGPGGGPGKYSRVAMKSRSASGKRK